MAKELTFGIQAAPVGEKPDHELYPEVVEDCRLAYELGYDSAWFLEHAFSDYYPTPSPLIFLSHVAAAVPNLNLGTAVLVLPWYNPLRIAGEIAMVNTLTKGRLMLGIGRGTAKSEYDAYGVDMNEARGRLVEVHRIVETALKGEPFTYDGTYFKITKPVQIRPAPFGKEVQFYGAIGSPGSAENVARMGLPLLCQSQFPPHVLTRVLQAWEGAIEKKPRPAAPHVISMRAIVAESDEAAQEIARKYLPRAFEVQRRHYLPEADPWEGIPEYAGFARMFENLGKLTDPDNLGPFMQLQLIGGPETVARRIEAIAELGFEYIVVAAAPPGFPQKLRQDTYRRFAREVAPRFSSRFR